MERGPAHDAYVDSGQVKIKDSNYQVCVQTLAQFFINVANNDFLNHKNETPSGYGYAVFGKVIQGQDVVDRIKSVSTGSYGPSQDVPKTPVIIKSIVPVQ